MSKKIAFLFPGQGSQYVGMGKKILEAYPETKEIFEQTDEICKMSISQLCFEGPMDELTLTENLQPAITAVNLACLKVLNNAGIQPYVSAGHSLGEYSALVSAGVLKTVDAIKLVKIRGALMHRESTKKPGTMAAIIGLDIEKVQEIVDKAKDHGVLSVANHNSREQIVITGEHEPLKKAIKIAKENKAKAIPLKVSGAWHSELMKDAVSDFRQFMEDIPFSTPSSKIIFNATAKEENDPELIKDIMANQLVSPVRWYESIINMLDQGVDTFVEVGPKRVLVGLMKKIVPAGRSVKIFNVEDPEGVERLINAI